MFTSYDSARDNMIALSKKVGFEKNNQIIDYHYLHNPSHLGGVGDITKAVYQGIFDKETVVDYDLVEILKDASEKIKTQKFLIVAHSQGNFYANSFYDVVAGQEGGAQAESMAVYSVATPASRVAGNGLWLTSDTDKVIAGIVDRVPFRKIMSPNTHIELQNSEDQNGHSFKDVYLKYNASRIISDITLSLDKLKTDDLRNEQIPCINNPEITFTHKIKGVIFAALDPIANPSVKVASIIVKEIYKTGKVVLNIVFKTTKVLANFIMPIFDIDNNLVSENTASLAFSNTGKLLSKEQENTLSNNISYDKEDEEYEKEILKQEKNKNDFENNNANFKELDEDEIYERNIEIENIKSKLRDLENQIKILISSSANNIKNDIENKEEYLLEKDKKLVSEENKKEDYIDKDVGGAKEYESYNQHDVIFSEIDWKGSSENSTYEWIELYGNNASAVNLEGWTIEKQDSNGVLSFLIGDSGDNFDNSHIISQGEYFLLERNELATNISSNKIYDGSLGNSGEYLLLKDANGNIIDEMNYLNGWPADSNDYSRTISKINGVWATSIETPKSVNQAYIPPQEEQQEENNEEAALPTYNERDIVINEIAWMGNSDNSANEWIELYNATSTEINLSGWTLLAQDNSPDISLSGTINSGEYFLLERTDDNSVSSVSANQIYSGAMSNTGELLILKDSNDKEIDRVDSWHAGNNDTKKTMQRISSTQVGTLSTNWITNSGTPKAQNNTSEEVVLPSYNSGDIVINEISWAGTFASTADEYIELRNVSSGNIDLTNWTIELIPNNASTTVIALSGTIQTGNATSTEPYFLMEHTDDNTVSNISADLIYSGSLNNDGMILYLKDPSNNIIDEVDASSGWPDGNSSSKRSMERKTELLWITFGETNEYGADGYYLNVDTNTFIKDANNNKIFGSPKRPNSDIEDYVPNGNLSFLLTFN
ncbi:MAG: lamin tail domain-containing protein [Patescibacteria group bacterium]